MLAAKIFLIVMTSLTASLGNSLLKKGATLSGENKQELLQARHIPRTFLQPAILAGVFIYGMSQLFWITVLRVADLSLVYPLQIGLNFTLIMLAAWIYFKEPVSKAKMLGVGMIFAGIVVMTLS